MMKVGECVFNAFIIPVSSHLLVVVLLLFVFLKMFSGISCVRAASLVAVCLWLIITITQNLAPIGTVWGGPSGLLWFVVCCLGRCIDSFQITIYDTKLDLWDTS